MLSQKILFSIITLSTLIGVPSLGYAQNAYYASESDVQNQYEGNNLYYYSNNQKGYVKLLKKKNKENWALYLTYGKLHYYDELGTDLLNTEIGGLGILYGANSSFGFGVYAQSNEHYGAMIRTPLFSWLKMRLMLGQTNETSYNEELTPDPEQRFGKTLSFGVGLDVLIFRRLGVTVQGFSSSSGNGGYNNEITYGLFWNF